MPRERNILGRPAFQWLLFLLALVLFYWPFLAHRGQWDQPYSYYLLMAAWGALVFLVSLVSRGHRARLPRERVSKDRAKPPRPRGRA